jgi:hypothetical protein
MASVICKGSLQMTEAIDDSNGRVGAIILEQLKVFLESL